MSPFLHPSFVESLLEQAGDLISATGSLLSTISTYVSAGISSAVDYIAANPGTFITAVFLPQVAVGYAIAETAWGLLSPLVSEVAVDYSNLQGAGYGRVGAGLISLVDVAGRPVEWLVLNALSEGRNREGQKLSALERVGYGVVGTIGTAAMFYAPARAIQVGIFAGAARLGAGSLAGGLVEAELAEAASGSGTALARQLGRAGEEAAGITGPKVGIRIPGSNQLRFPDALDLEGKVLTEVKNVAKLSYTQQLRDYALFAAENGLHVNLIVRRSTKLSRPLLDAIDAGLINLPFFLP